MELMAEWQWKRWDAVARLGAGKLTLQEAARVLRLSVRQVRRIRRTVERAGRAGLRHGNAGQVPLNKLRAAVRHRILRLRRTKYRDLNDAQLAEEQPPIRVSVRTPTTCVGGMRAAEPCASDGDCPDGECGPGLFEFRDRMVDGVGPVVIPRLAATQGVCEAGPDAGAMCMAAVECPGSLCVDYRAEAESPVPLEGLGGTQNVFTFAVSEAIAGTDLNGDGDRDDLVLTLRDRTTGETLPIGVGG